MRWDYFLPQLDSWMNKGTENLSNVAMMVQLTSDRWDSNIGNPALESTV